MRERIAWVDFAKGFIMIAVVFLHASIPDTAVNKFLGSFRMPFFFVMAGFLLNLDKWGGVRNYSPFVTKLYHRLLRPYFLAELLWYPIWFIVCYEAGFLGHLWHWCTIDPFQALAMIFIGNGNDTGLLLGQLWFLFALFFTQAIFLELYNRLHDLDAEIFALAVVTVSSLGFCFAKYFVMLWDVDIALAAQVFILAGVLIRKHNFIERINLKACLVSVLILIAAFGLNEHINMSNRVYGNALLFYAGGIAGTLLVMKLSALMSTGGKVFALISACGRQSMMILVLHPIIANVFYEMVDATSNIPPEEFFSTPIIIFGATLAGVTVPLIIAERFGKLPGLKYFCP